MADVTSEDIRKMLDEATPGPWWVCNYDAGDCHWYDHNGPCPSIQAPDAYDCAVVHWDGFKQEYWSACDGNQKQIEANARLIAAAPDLAAEVLRLRALLAECADDLSGRVGNDWPEMSRAKYPSIEAKYRRDMDIVYRARAALGDNHE
jgi:hypothetical protein